MHGKPEPKEVNLLIFRLLGDSGAVTAHWPLGYAQVDWDRDKMEHLACGLIAGLYVISDLRPYACSPGQSVSA